MLAECEPDTSRSAILPLLGLDLTGELGRLQIPTLVVGGTADLLTPPVDSPLTKKNTP